MTSRKIRTLTTCFMILTIILAIINILLLIFM
nr:MAG TPA: hypothetical protein [Caudoviricetes sp.]